MKLRSLRASTLALLAIGLLSRGQPLLADSTTEEARLRSLSGEQRRALAGKLDEFERLPPADQKRIRALDARLKELPEDERDNRLAVLHRYHVWLAGLTEAERTEINEAAPEDRMALISRIKASQQSKTPPPPLLLLAADFGGFSALELANRIKIYLALDPAMKAEVNRLPEPARMRRLQELGRQLRVEPVPRITMAQEEKAFEGAMRSTMFPLLKRPEELVKMGRLKQRLAESAHFSEHPPERVSSENLLRFVEALPVWSRTLIDPMPPEEARRRLTVLYRLIHPAPSEMPAPTPPPSTSGKVAPGRPAVPKVPTAPTAPF